MKLFPILTENERIESNQLLEELQKPIELGTFFVSVKPRLSMLNRLMRIDPLSYFKLVYIPIIYFVIILFLLNLIF